MAEPQEIADKILSGDLRSAARLIRDIDDEQPVAVEVLKLLHPHRGRAYVIGITGSPGVGKSTLTDTLVTRFRGEGKTVGVVAVDPTSPFTGGAILGDRVRMQRHATDEGVFIRSLATRGHFGGLTASTRGVVTVMDAMGKDVVLVETVGVGQDEVDIVRTADTTMIVTVGGLGDDIQAIKAGILEVGDLFVVNKADRPGAEGAANQLKAMLEMEREQGRYQDWLPPVLLASARDGEGLAELMEALGSHRAHLSAEGGRLLRAARTERARMELLDMVRTGAAREVSRRLQESAGLEDLVEGIARGEDDPYSACERVLAGMFGRN